MRTFAGLLALLTACAAKAPALPPSTLDVPPIASARVASPNLPPRVTFASVLRSRDATRLSEFYAPHGHLSYAGWPHHPTDREMIATFYRELFEKIPTFEEVEIASFESRDGRQQYSIWTYRGRGAMSSRRYGDDGLIVEEHIYFDELGDPPAVPFSLPSDLRTVVATGADDDSRVLRTVQRAGIQPTIPDVPLYDNTADWRRAPEFFSEWKQGFPSRHLEMRTELVVGNFVFREDTFTGTFAGRFRGLAPTKREIDLDEAWVYETKDGALVRIFRFANREELDRQLGLRPSGPIHH